MSPVVGLIFDVAILVALGATIFYCLRLSRQFNEMQANRKAFEALIASLNVAAGRADGVIRSIRDAAVSGGENLQEKINRARALSDEMEIIIQAGDNLANRLQRLAEKTPRNPAEEDILPEDAPEAPEEPMPKTRVEKELMEALKAKQQG